MTTKPGKWQPLLASVLMLLSSIVRSNARGLGRDGNCPILTLLPFTYQKKGGPRARPPPEKREKRLERWTPPVLHHFAYSYMAAAQMAMDHFNERDSSVVPELSQLEDCTVKFPAQVVVDSGLKETNAVMGILSSHYPSLLQQTQPQSQLPQTSDNCPTLQKLTRDNLLPPWCAILGPRSDRSVTQVGALTAALETPQILYGPVSRLAYQQDVPSTIAVNLPDVGLAKAIVGYLQRPGLQREYLAILHSPVPSIDLLVQEIEKWNTKDVGLKSVSIMLELKDKSKDPMVVYAEAVKWLRQTGIKTILLAISFPHDLRGLAQALEEENMFGEDYVYLLLEEALPLDQIGEVVGEEKQGSPFDKLLNGAAIISQTDRFVLGSALQEDDPFGKAWRMQNSSFVEYLNELVPKDDLTGKAIFQAQPTYFQDEFPAAMATFIFDSVIAVGIGACKYQQTESQLVPNGGQSPSNGGQMPSSQQGQPQQEGMFQGQPPSNNQMPPPPQGGLPQGQPPLNGGQMPPDQQGQPQQQGMYQGQPPTTNQMPPPPQGSLPQGQAPPDGGQTPPTQQGQPQQQGVPQGFDPGERRLAKQANETTESPTEDSLVKMQFTYNISTGLRESTTEAPSPSTNSNATLGEHADLAETMQEDNDDFAESNPIDVDRTDTPIVEEPMEVGGDDEPEIIRPAPEGTGPGKPSLVKSILETSFSGASGEVSFGFDFAKARDFQGVVVGAYNIRPSSVNQSTGLRTYTSTLTSYATLSSSNSLDKWNSIPNETFIYRDGQTVAPKLLREIDNQNFLSEWVHIVGLVLFAVALFSAVSCGVAIWYLEKDRIVLAGQPPFLYLLCFGSALMSGAIFTLSWDESYGWSHKQLDIACALTPWFFFVGHLLMFSALFTKLWRVDKVLQFSRRKVTIVQVLGPLVALLLAAVTVLSVWTALDPWVWERSLLQETPAETYGECTSERFVVWFSLLAALLVLAKVTTAAMAWKTADIPQDFSDASSVFYAISTHLQAWFIGIPILIVLGNDSSDATYFGRVLLIWIFSVSGVGLVVLPKITKALYERRHPEHGQKDRVRVSGYTPSDPRQSKGSGDGTHRPSSGMSKGKMSNGEDLSSHRGDVGAVSRLG